MHSRIEREKFWRSFGKAIRKGATTAQVKGTIRSA